MNCDMLIPDESVDKITCSLCNNYLSYFPVLLIEEEKNVCGRCTLPEGKISFRNKAFEEIAQHVKFPCRFKKNGCCRELCPKDVPSHEKNCHFKTVGCPGKVLIRCNWQGSYNNMLTHCLNSHQAEFLQNNLFEVILNDSDELTKFLEYDEKLFMVSVISDVALTNTVSFMMYHVEEAIDLENYSYQIAFTRDKFTVVVKSDTTSFREKKFNQVSLDCLLKNNADTSPIIGNINFEKNFFGREINETLLSSLACRCSSYLQNYHTYQEKNCKCKIEKSDMTKIIEMLDYPCLYKNNGCSVVLKSEKMKSHLWRCPLKNESCQFCKWQGLNKDLKSHVFETHHDVIIESNAIFSANKSTSLSRIIQYGNHLFKLEYKMLSHMRSQTLYYNTYSWNVSRLICTPEDGFHYEIEIMNTERTLRLLLKRSISADGKHEPYTFKSSDVVCLGMGNNFTFKINIHEN